ncbi:MAG: hypothetical protein RIS94_1221 [Pseudomonadota bacterium]|jgi:NADPH2:quinone reductase
MTMRALEVTALTPDLAGAGLAARAVPRPGPDDVLVRIEAAAPGFPDLLMTQGLYQARPPLPYIAGMECAGVVEQAGGQTGFSPGDRVIAGGLTGAIAQYGCFPAGAVHFLPDGLSVAQGAALRIAYLTAWVALVRLGRAQAGEWLVVHGATGGVGLAAVDLARALGLRVIAVVSSAEKAAALAALHAPDHVLVGPTGLRDEIRALTGGAGADLVFDPVGGDVFDEACRYTAFAGRLLVVGFASGRIPQLSANIPLIKGFSVIGVRAGEYGRRFPDHGREHHEAILRLAGEGRIRPHVHAQVPLDQWRTAFEALRDRAVLGRTVILPHA